MARSRGQAHDLIRAGQVVVPGRERPKASTPVLPGVQVSVESTDRQWVGRAAIKLDRALEAWGPSGLVVRRRRCLDVGASTGGFTQVLLERGAREVVAVDVGQDQLVLALRDDARVIDLSGRHIMSVSPGDVGDSIEVAVVDLSFISVTTVLAHIVSLLTHPADVVLLVKPQFEVGPHRVSGRGVVRSSSSRAEAVQQVLVAAAEVGAGVMGLMASPIEGRRGNHEYLLWVRCGAPGMMDLGAARALAARITAEETR